ncbi:MAG: TetR/AcrR family transcriptional regulator [Pseudomonadales bacterium]|nr:TetR/AcrR family transcriptional regulator [Pseudomonadales bacterium]
MNTRQKRTKERILDAAELLFEERGFESTSTRRIAEAANANSAAPNFHFTSKENLIKEVFRRRMGPLVEQRMSLLTSVLKNQDKPDVAAIYDSFVDPLIELRQGSDKNKQAFLLLLARNALAPRKEFNELLETELMDYVTAYAKALQQVLPHLKPRTISLRFDLAMATIARAFNDPEGNMDKVVKQFVLAGLTADT